MQLEFKDKLMSCEKKFHGEYQASLFAELQKQDEILWSNFDKITSEKQAIVTIRKKRATR